MTKHRVFYSFHYDEDVMRVQQIRNIGALDGNIPVSPNDWEDVKKGGDAAIKRWIDDAMEYRSTVIVLIGAQTANRKWINYEIEKAWTDKKTLFGIYIHDLKDPKNGKSTQGKNPFDFVATSDGTLLSNYVDDFHPDGADAYNDIANNIETWITIAGIQSAVRN